MTAALTFRSLAACFMAGALLSVATPVAAAAGPDVLARPGAQRPEKGGLASITRDRLEGYPLASGERYDRNALTAAHRTLPFNTLVRVTNVRNHRTVIVRINDRAAAVGNHVIDLTPRAGAALGMIGIETAEVQLEVIGAAAALPPADRADPQAPPVK